MWLDDSSYQSNKVPGVLAAEVSAAAEDNQSDEEERNGNNVHPWISLNKDLCFFAKGEEGHNGESEQELHCENHEDLVKKRNLDD